MNTGLKVFLSSAFGAVVGGTVADVITHHWWIVLIGTIVGGLTGYLSYEYRTAIAAMRHAWSTTAHWKPDWKQHHLTVRACLVFSVLMLCTILPIVIPAVWVMEFLHDYKMWISRLYPVARDVTIFALFITNLLVAWTSRTEAAKKSFQSDDFSAKGTLKVIRQFWCWIPGMIWKILVLLWSEVITPATRGTRRFLWKCFCLIHSEVRLLCGLSAMTGVLVGALVGHHLWGVLIGGITAGAIGLASFEILSIRALKLIPRSQSFFTR